MHDEYIPAQSCTFGKLYPFFLTPKSYAVFWQGLTGSWTSRTHAKSYLQQHMPEIRDSHLVPSLGGCLPSRARHSLRFIRRLTPYNVSVRTWASCAVELTSGLELITSFRLLRFYFSSNFYVSYIIGKLGICSFQRYATPKNLSSRKGAVIS